MTAADIQRRLIVDRYRRNFLLPNFTPNKWWECDVFELTPAGFFREYEIKLSRADFKADATKERKEWLGWNVETGNKYNVERKHELLAKADPRGPNQFWYVFPEGLMIDSEVPAWAGIIHVKPFGAKGPWCVHPMVIRQAPKLHNGRIDPKVREYAAGICYWRFQNMFLHGRITAEAEAA